MKAASCRSTDTATPMTTLKAPLPNPLPVLYSFRRCPYAMRARLALRVAGQAVEHREIELKNKAAAMLQASPKGTVPVLVLADGTVLDQSLDIMRWALERHDPEAWLPTDEASCQDAWALIAQNDGDFKFHLDRYKYPHRYGLADGVAHRAQASVFLEALALRLTASAYLSGPRLGLADAAILPFVRQFAHTDKAWFAQQNWPELAQWLANFEASVAFAQVMEKHPVWPGVAGGLAPGAL